MMDQTVETQERRQFPYRLIYLGLVMMVVAAVAFGIAFGRGGEPTPLPTPIESLTPRPNERALAQTVLEVDLEPGYLAQVFVDGFPVPETELIFVEATGVHRWQPNPASLIFPAWTPGEHTIRIVWDSLAGLPRPGEFTWTFRIQ
jgi:hypothetical protein